MSDQQNPFTLSETVRTLGRHIQEDIRQVMEAETDVVSGIVGGHQLKIIEWLDVVEQQIMVINQRLDALEREKNNPAPD